MFKNKIIRFLKDNKEYSKLLKICNKNENIKHIFNSVINSPYLVPIIHFLIGKTPSITKLSINEKLLIDMSDNTSIVIYPLYNNKFDEVRNYLYNNGIIWRTYQDVLDDTINDMFKKEKIALCIQPNGLLSWAEDISWISNKAYANGKKYKVMELTEFYDYFNNLKKYIKLNIHKIVINDNYKHYFK